MPTSARLGHLPPRVLGIVQAGGQGSRMDVLTRERAKPALPWGGTHQLIDFALSNLANSGIANVWVSVQYLAGTLDEHLQSGRPWDLDRNRGGYRRLVPEAGRAPAAGGFSTGNADDLFRSHDDIARHDPDVVVVSSADHVFACDLRPIIAAHLEAGAVTTIVTAEVPPTDARHKGVVRTTGRERSLAGGCVSAREVAALDYKPDRADDTTVATEVFVYTTDALLGTLASLWRERDHAAVDEERADSGLGDFGERLLPALIDSGTVLAVDIGSYWRDVGRPQAYLQSHRDLVRGRVGLLADTAWPIQTTTPYPAPARIRDGARITDSVLAGACDVAGEVVGSVLGPGVRVERGARVVDSVLFGGVHVAGGAVVETSIVDEQTRIGRAARVGERAAGRLSDDRITLLGRDCVVPRGQELPAGARLEPGTR